MKLWRNQLLRRQTADAPPVHSGASAELSASPTALLRLFRRDLAAAFELARDANDQRAIDAALRLIGRVESELETRTP